MTTQTDLRLNIPAPAVSPGSRVRIAPHMAGTRAYADARGYTGIVQSLSEGYTTFARVCFDRGEFMPPLEKDVAAAHLIVIPADSETPKRATRRAPSLRLTEPQDTRNEAARQAEAVKFFTNLTPPYFVHEIGGKRRGYKCHSCGDYVPQSGSVGNTLGSSDLQISRADYPVGAWANIEYKDGPQPSKLRPEQKELLAAGRIFVAWNLKTCIEAVYAFEDADPRITVHPVLVERIASYHREVAP